MPLLMIFQSNWKVICLGATIAIFGGFCYHKGAESVQGKWDAANAQAALKAHDTEIFNAKTAYEIGIGYESSRFDIDNSFNGYINGLHTTSADLPDKSNPASKPDAAACANRISQANKRAALELARQAEYNTQKLIALQKWIDESK